MKKSELSARDQEVLRAVVNTFVETGEPVGSRTLSKRIAIGMSPATIRNVMSDLAESGYLTKPHASAGRLPTDLGYRVFVDALMESHRITSEEQASIRQSYAKGLSQVEQVVVQASKILSELTNQAGIALLPGREQLQFQHIQFIRMTSQRILVVVVSKSGVVQNRVVQSDEDFSQGELDRISRYLNDKFSGLSLREIREKVLEQMGQERDYIDLLYKRAADLSRLTFLEDEESPDPSGDSLFVEGASRVYSQPDFASDFEKLQNLYRAFEEKGKIVRILDGCLDTEDVSVLIGSENDIEGMSDCSLVAHSYFIDDRPLGTIGIIGPKRMRYDRMVSLVEWTADAMSRFLSSRDLKEKPE